MSGWSALRHCKESFCIILNDIIFVLLFGGLFMQLKISVTGTQIRKILCYRK